MDANYWQGYHHGYLDCQRDETNGEPGMRLSFYQPFIERGVEAEYAEAANANPERVNNGCQIYKQGQS